MEILVKTITSAIQVTASFRFLFHRPIFTKIDIFWMTVKNCQRNHQLEVSARFFTGLTSRRNLLPPMVGKTQGSVQSMMRKTESHRQ